MKLLQFGAGNIGRSFIGQLFSAAGYEVVFADVDRRLIAALNEKRGYTVAVRDKENRDIPVRNVRAIMADDADAVSRELSEADVCGTAVGPKVLPKLFPVIAKALVYRQYQGKGPLDFILCENLRNAAGIVREGLKTLLPWGFPIDSYAGLVETSIGKMVPLVSEAEKSRDPLTVYAEAYNTLILDGSAFKNGAPNVPGLSPKKNMKAWVDRKSFVHNLGHASLAYFAFLDQPKMVYTWEAVMDAEIRAWTKATMAEACAWLSKTYPADLSSADLSAHTEDLLTRFANKNLGDTLHRVGRDLARKLSAEDRVTGALLACRKANLSHKMILNALAAGLFFLPPDSDGKVFAPDEQIVRRAEIDGPEDVIKEIAGENNGLPDLVGKIYWQIKLTGGIRDVIRN